MLKPVTLAKVLPRLAAAKYLEGHSWLPNHVVPQVIRQGTGLQVPRQGGSRQPCNHLPHKNHAHETETPHKDTSYRDWPGDIKLQHNQETSQRARPPLSTTPVTNQGSISIRGIRGFHGCVKQAMYAAVRFGRTQTHLSDSCIGRDISNVRRKVRPSK